MATAAIDYSEIVKGIPSGAWVAISEQNQTVVAYGADLATVLNAARDRGEDHPLIVRIPEQTSVLFL